jgi:hypothetical protein
MSRSAHRFVLKKKRVAGMAVGAIAMLAMAGPALAQAPDTDAFKVTTAIQAGTNNLVSFDISWFDPKLKKYFLADRSNNDIDIVDPSDNSITHIAQGLFAGVVLNPDGTANNDKSGPDGVLTVHRGEDEDEGGVTELWVGDSPGKVWVLNALTGANILGDNNFISVGGTTRADELCFDSKDHLIMIASPGEGDGTTSAGPFVTFISTKTHKVVANGRLVFDGTNGTVQATGGLEQCGWSRKTGKFYQNVPVAGKGPSGVIAVIDPETVLAGHPKVMTNLPVADNDCDLPQGMAIGPDDQIMLGCNGPSLGGNGLRNTAMVNINTGATLPGGFFANLGGVDEVWFNKGDGHYFFPSCNTACRAGTASEVLGIVDTRGPRLDQTVVLATTLGTTATSRGRRAHSVAADPDTLQVYVPLPACVSSGGMCVTGANDASNCANAPTKVGSPTAVTGCILVLKGTPDADDRVAREGENDQGENDNSQD